MTDAAGGGRHGLLSGLPAVRSECLFAGGIIAASMLVFVVLAPFAKMPLRPLPVFIPIYQSAFVINDLITAVFLLSERQFSRSNALSVLAGGYLFTALMSIIHGLTFPGLFAPAGLLDAGPQSTAWLYMFWHSGFPLFVLIYAFRNRSEHPSRRGGTAILLSAGLVIALVSGFTLLATWGQNILPPIMQGYYYTPVASVVIWSVWSLNMLALIVMLRRSPYSVLDLWLVVTMFAWLFDIALSAGLNSGRYDLGFYAGRIYGLLAASFILIVLLIQNGRLHVQLIALYQSDREKAEELRRLSTVDPLTGIANRRAFEEALDQEWRRMMRHQGALSLLMVDVDYFKRFNDGYGHVAGDECLRMVAQTLGKKARRAGELAARYGGEEFAVLLPHTDIADAAKLAELLVISVRDLKIPHKGSEVAPFVTVSIGVANIADLPKYAATMSRDGNLPSATLPGAMAIVEIADHALYQAKAAGRNRAVIADDNGQTAVAA